MKWLGLIINHCSNDHHFNYHNIGLCMVKDITNLDCFTPWNVVLPFILYHYAERDPFIIVDCMLCLLSPPSNFGTVEVLDCSEFYVSVQNQALNFIQNFVGHHQILANMKEYTLGSNFLPVSLASFTWIRPFGTEVTQNQREREKLFKNLTEVRLVAVTIHCKHFTMLLQSRVCIWKNSGLLQLNLTAAKIIHWLLLLLPQSSIRKSQCMPP